MIILSVVQYVPICSVSSWHSLFDLYQYNPVYHYTITIVDFKQSHYSSTFKLV